LKGPLVAAQLGDLCAALVVKIHRQQQVPWTVFEDELLLPLELQDPVGVPHDVRAQFDFRHRVAYCRSGGTNYNLSRLGPPASGTRCANGIMKVDSAGT
jgi:hypothetical protein